MLTSANIFHYGNCSKCGCMKNDVRATLSHLFLPHTCEQISDYNVYCKGCSKARDKETHMVEKGKIYKMSVIEIQLDYFRLNKRLFYADSPKTAKVREMNRLIYYFEDEDQQINTVLKKLFKDNYGLLSVFIIPDVYDKDKLYDRTMELQMEEEGFFRYNKRVYRTKPLILNLLWMYVADIIGDDSHLVDMGRIKGCLNDFVWNGHDD